MYLYYEEQFDAGHSWDYYCIIISGKVDHCNFLFSAFSCPMLRRMKKERLWDMY